MAAALLLTGAALIVAGVYLISLEAALIVAGLLAVAASVDLTRRT